MKLYYHPVSPNCYPVLAVAKELGLDLELHQVDPLSGGTRSPEYLQMNPNGKVPVLVDDDFILWESGAIMEYLAGKAPQHSLFPEGARTRIDIVRWQLWHQAHWMHACGTLLWENVIKKLAKMGDPDPVELKKGEEEVKRFGAVLNQCLEGKTFLVNDQLTLADFAVAAPMVFADVARFPLESFSHIKKWYGRLNELDSWRSVQPKLS